MSAASKAMPQLTSETTTKKKFGKNLNKLTKPPAPAAASVPKQSSASRNGLLLLSTKRASSGTGAAASSGGILSNKSSQPSAKPLPILGLQYESNTSTHDALLGAVVGASRAETQQPDAWGVADKQQKGEPNGTAEVETPKTPEVKPVEATTRKAEEDIGPMKESPSRNDIDEANRPNWDEYGGRNLSPENNAQALANTDDDYQVNYMSNRARERSEQRRSEEEARMILQKERANQRLRELEEKIDSTDTNDEAKPRQQRTLYDPNRPCSSAAGGTNGHDMGSVDMELSSPRRVTNAPDDGRDLKVKQQPMIKLSSYDDRDRGTSAGPRMLYDPKSGSMVTVSSREDPNKGRGGRKDRKKGRNARDKDSKADSRSDNDGATKTRKGKSRRDETSNQQNSSADSKRGRNLCDKRLPRTCGVLYKKDSKGHFVCADETEGDLGYGAHSVPGGKNRNPDAYAQMAKEKKRSAEEAKIFDQSNGSPRKDRSNSESNSAAEVTLQTGLISVEPEPIHDWVLPNEKISLVTGNDDSPTLQATAKAWAPSEAALSAAVKAAAGRSVNISVDSKEEEQVEQDDGDNDDDVLGLGFDPTLHMDSMMQSPSAEPTSNLDTVDFAAISLEPAMQTTGQNTHSIFAFESGSTWGNGNTDGHSDWGIPASSSGNIFKNDDAGSGGVASSFLSLATGTGWGNVNLTGSPIGSSALNEHAGPPTTGD